MQKIIVKNFRQISNAEIEIKKILFFIGDQASGKSTLAKLIYFFKSLKEDYFNLIYEKASTPTTSLNLEKLFIKKIQDKFKIYFGYTSELDQNFEIIYYYLYDKNNAQKCRYLKLSKDNSLQIQFDYSYFGQITNDTRELVKAFNEYTQKQTQSKSQNNYVVLERSKMRFINELTQKVANLFYDDFTPTFFPDGRNITVSYPEQFKSKFLSNISGDDNAKSVDILLMNNFILHSKFLFDYFNGKNFGLLLNNITKDHHLSKKIFEFAIKKTENILKGKYDNTDGSEKIIYNSSDKKSVSLNIASSGQKEVIRIIQDVIYILYENQKSFRIIEEPEAHLFPNAQKSLIELLMLMVNKTNSQIIITTHSPYILSIFNNLLMYSLVISKNTDKAEIIKIHFETIELNGIDERIDIKPDEIAAYSLNVSNSNYCQTIIDKETGLIGENYLDSITEELNNDFDVLSTINFQKK